MFYLHLRYDSINIKHISSTLCCGTREGKPSIFKCNSMVYCTVSMHMWRWSIGNTVKLFNLHHPLWIWRFRVGGWSGQLFSCPPNFIFKKLHSYGIHLYCCKNLTHQEVSLRGAPCYWIYLRPSSQSLNFNWWRFVDWNIIIVSKSDRQHAGIFFHIIS